jgi:hypothetical protein
VSNVDGILFVIGDDASVRNMSGFLLTQADSLIVRPTPNGLPGHHIYLQPLQPPTSNPPTGFARKVSCKTLRVFSAISASLRPLR